MFSAFLHCLVLLVFVVGSGFWFWRFTGRRSPVRGHWWLWCGLAGFAIETLLVEQTNRLGLSLRVVSWVTFVAALGGVAGAVGAWRTTNAALRRRLCRQCAAVGAVLVAVGLAQGASWLARGPEHYFGRARIDQLNYVLLSEYLIEMPGGTTIDQIGLRPWMALPTDLYTGRITQCVPQAQLAVITGQDAQRTYGAISIAYVALLAAAVHGLLRTWGMRARWSLLAGVAAGLLPAVTTTHLEGFFSQIAVMWVLPAIAGILARHRPWVGAAVGAGALVGFFVGAYVEYALVPAVAGVVTVRWGAGWRLWLRTAGVVGASAGLLNAFSLPRLAEYLVSQLGRAKDPNMLAYLVPGSGTLAGWSREFFGPELPWSTLAGAALSVLALAAMVLAPRPWRLRAVVLFAGPLALALPMLLAPQLPVYPFGKLLRMAAPLVVVALALFASRGRGWWRPVAALGALGAVLMGGVAAVVPAQREVIAGTTAVADADLAVVRREPVFGGSPRLETSTVLIDGDRPLTNGWLAYHARRHRVYLLRQDVTDRVLPEEFSACRRWPEGLRDVYVVSRDAVEHRDFVAPTPRLSAENGEELRAGPGRTWRGKGTLWLRLDRAPEEAAATSEYRWVCFALRCATPGASFSLRTPGVPRVSRFPAGERWTFRAEWSGPATRFSIQGPDAETEFYVVAIGVEPPDRPRSATPPMGFFAIDLGATAPP